MSLYNMVHGMTPAVFFVLPLLDLGHPDELPRFRDCFLEDEEHPEYAEHIFIYTRVGGNNRKDYDTSVLENHPLFVATYDNSFDNTFGMYVFKIPAEFEADVALLADGEVAKMSAAAQAKCREVYPKLKDKFDEVWGTTTGGTACGNSGVRSGDSEDNQPSDEVVRTAAPPSIAADTASKKGDKTD